MSQAFVKENDDNELLNHVQPSLVALIRYLKQQNNGRNMYQTKSSADDNGKEIFEMSNGLAYFLNDVNEWQMVF